MGLHVPEGQESAFLMHCIVPLCALQLLPFTRWGGAMVDSSKTDKACPLTVQDLVRLARAAGSNKSYFQAWELPHGYR